MHTSVSRTRRCSVGNSRCRRKLARTLPTIRSSPTYGRRSRADKSSPATVMVSSARLTLVSSRSRSSANPARSSKRARSSSWSRWYVPLLLSPLTHSFNSRFHCTFNSPLKFDRPRKSRRTFSRSTARRRTRTRTSTPRPAACSTTTACASSSTTPLSSVCPARLVRSRNTSGTARWVCRSRGRSVSRRFLLLS